MVLLLRMDVQIVVCHSLSFFPDLRIPLMWKDTEYFKNKGGRFPGWCSPHCRSPPPFRLFLTYRLHSRAIWICKLRTSLCTGDPLAKVRMPEFGQCL